MVEEFYFHTSTYKGKPGLVKKNTTGVVIANTNETVGETVPEEALVPAPESEQETEAVISPNHTSDNGKD